MASNQNQLGADTPEGEGTGATIGRITMSGYGRVRTNLDVQYLLAAASLARDVADLEKSNAGGPFGDFFERVLGYSTGCIVLATGALEAYVNLLFADRAAYFSARDQEMLDLVWREYERKSALDKVDLARRLKVVAPLDRGCRTTQSVDRLIRLRNALVHFVPEWPDEPGEHLKLSGQLEHYVGRSPWLPDEPLFPRAWATSSTTAWAVSSVRHFVAEFAADSGLPDRFAKFEDRLSTGPQQ